MQTSKHTTSTIVAAVRAASPATECPQRHHTGTIAASVNAAYPEVAPRQTLFTVTQFAEIEPAFTAASLRNLIFKAEPRHSSKGDIAGNGLLECGAIVRNGRKVMIHRERFLAWVQK